MSSSAGVPLASYVASGEDPSALAGPSGIFPSDEVSRKNWGNVTSTYGGASDQAAYQTGIAAQFGSTPMDTRGSVPDDATDQTTIMDESLKNFEVRHFDAGANVFAQGYGVMNSNHVIMPRINESVRAAMDSTQNFSDFRHPEEGMGITKFAHKVDSIPLDAVAHTFVPRNPANRSDKGINAYESRRDDFYNRSVHVQGRVGSKAHEAPPGTELKEYQYNMYTGKQWDRPETGAKFMRRLHKPAPSRAHKQRNLSDFERHQGRQSFDRSYTPVKVADQDPRRTQTLYDAPRNADVSEMVQYEGFEVPRGAGFAGGNEGVRLRPDTEQSLRMPRSTGDEAGGTTVFNRWGNPGARWNELSATTNDDRLEMFKQDFTSVRGYDPVSEINEAAAEDRAAERLRAAGENDEFGVGPEFRYTMRKSTRGTALEGVTDMTKNYSRAGNKRNLGGVGAYAVHQETGSWMNSLPQSKMRGRYEHEWFSAPYQKDGGIAGAWEGKNFGGQNTRGGTRMGGPKRSDYMAIDQSYRAVPFHGTHPQNNNVYGIRDDQRKTPVVHNQDPADPIRTAQLHQNPFVIPSYGLLQAAEELKENGVQGYLPQSATTGVL